MAKGWGFALLLISFISVSFSIGGIQASLAQGKPDIAAGSKSLTPPEPLPKAAISGLPNINWQFTALATHIETDHAQVVLKWQQPEVSGEADFIDTRTRPQFKIQYAVDSSLNDRTYGFNGNFNEFCRAQTGPWDYVQSGSVWENLANPLGLIPGKEAGGQISTSFDQARTGRPAYFRLLLDGAPNNLAGETEFKNIPGKFPVDNGVDRLFVLACTTNPLTASNEVNPDESEQYQYAIKATLDSAEADATVKAFIVLNHKSLPVPKKTPVTVAVKLADVPRDQEVKFMVTLTYQDSSGQSQTKTIERTYRNDRARTLSVDFHKDNKEPSVTEQELDPAGVDTNDALAEANGCSSYLGFREFNIGKYLTCETVTFANFLFKQVQYVISIVPV